MKLSIGEASARAMVETIKKFDAPIPNSYKEARAWIDSDQKHKLFFFYRYMSLIGQPIALSDLLPSGESEKLGWE